VRNARRILIEICSCAAVFAIALIFAYAVFACSGFAVAQDEKAFVISTADGDDSGAPLPLLEGGIFRHRNSS